MALSLTSKGKAWEIRNSLWMLWTLVTMGFLNYVSFFYIARKVKQKKWFKAGLVYSVIFVIFMMAPESFTPFFIITWFVSIFHVFKIRAEYLLRLEAVQASGLDKKEISALRERIAREYGTSGSVYKSAIDVAAEEKIQEKPKNISVENGYNEALSKSSSAERIDINSASEKEISEVPGIGTIFASKVVAVRSIENGFDSFDHFVQALSIKPHVAEKIKSHVVFSQMIRTRNKEEKVEGRIVDY